MQRGKGFDLVIRKLVGFDQSKIEFGMIILVFGSSLPHGMYTTWR